MVVVVRGDAREFGLILWYQPLFFFFLVYRQLCKLKWHRENITSKTIIGKKKRKRENQFNSAIMYEW